MTGFPEPWGFAVFPRLLGSVVVTGFGSDATSYHGDCGLWQRFGGAQPRLLRQLGDGSFLFEGVDERQDTSLHARRHPTGH